MSQIEIKAYDNEGRVTKICKAKMIDLKFGTIRAIMEVLNIENISDTAQLLNTIYGAWDQVVDILTECFPDMEKDDWENVKVKELMPVIMNILRYSFSEILTIPKDPKN